MALRDAAEAALNHIRERLVLPVGAPLEKFAAPEVVWRWRNDLLTLDHFADSALDAAANRQIDELLDTSGNLWRLLTENADALEEIEDYKRARLLDAESTVIGIGEEFFTGEDQGIRDILVNALTFFLGWKANTVWVEAGRKSRRAMARGCLPEIQRELWGVLRLTSGIDSADLTMERARDIGERAEKVVELLAAASLPTNAQVALLTFLLHWALRLRLGKLILTLEPLAAEGGESGAS